MKPSLQLRIGQQLTMTPQLQQAIRLLQLSTLDLQTEIQTALDENPMLEQQEEKDDNLASTDTEAASETLTQELPVDSEWEDTYPQSQLSASNSVISSDYVIQDETTETLVSHLKEQLNLCNLSEIDMAIGFILIDGISNDGLLRIAIEDVSTALGDIAEVSLEEVEAVLHRIQTFDPLGVGARDLRECLLLQLAQIKDTSEVYQLTYQIINQHLELLAKHSYPQLMRFYKIKEAQLQQVIALIQSLNPKPGHLIEPEKSEYIIPDVFVKKYNGQWLVELNGDAIPRLRINAHYASFVKRADNSTDNTYLRGQLQEARWLLKSLESRNQTLLKVATCIVESQQSFLEHGEEAMKPMILHHIADKIEMHESTISRVTTQKYMHTPKGIFELKYFFSSHVNTDLGGACSSTAIRALIKKLIAAETPNKPLSDNKLALLLQEQGIQIARRTVAKYREAMHIPSSNARKQLNNTLE